MSSLIYYFPVDLTGNDTTNLVNRESHLLLIHAGTDYSVFSLNHGGFYADSLIIEDSDYNQLIPNVDYVVDYVYQDASDRTGLLVAGVVVIINQTLTGVLYASAQMLGGGLAFDLDASQTYIQHLIDNPSFIPTWGTYIGNERQWGPGELEAELWTETGIQDVNIELENLAQVIKAGDQVALMNYRATAKNLRDSFITGVGTTLQTHEADYNDPHNVTKAQVGLGFVENYPIATETQARDGVADIAYMTPLRTAQAIDTQILQPLAIHSTNTNNPHNTTAAQIGAPSQIEVNNAMATKLSIGAMAANAVSMVSPVRHPMVYNFTKQDVSATNWVGIARGPARWIAINDDIETGMSIFFDDSINKMVGSTSGNDPWNFVLFPGQNGRQLRGICYGVDKFVVVSSGGPNLFRFLTSADGFVWAEQTSPGDVEWKAVTYGGGLFVAIGNGGDTNRIATSPNGISWTIRSAPISRAWSCIAHGNGRFVILPSSGNTGLYSDDGITWVEMPIVNRNWTGIAFGNGRFVALSDDAPGAAGIQAAVSTDGVTFSIRNTPTVDGQTIRSVAFGDGYFFAVCANNTRFNLLVSYNGDGWQLRTTPVDGPLTAIGYGGGGFRAIGEGESIYWSHNLNQGEGVLTTMTYGEVFSRLRSQLPTSLISKLPFNSPRIGAGTSYNAVLGMDINGPRWTDRMWYLTVNNITITPTVHFMEYYGTEANAIASISAIYNDIATYPEGTVVLFRISEFQAIWRRVMRAALRTSTGWNQL